MDQATIIPNTIVQKFSALYIDSSGDTPITSKTPLYRQPGYSTQNLDLMQLLSKPIALPPITIDSSWTHWTNMISSLEPIFRPWALKFLDDFISFRFNLQVTLVLPGHQFAVCSLVVPMCQI